MIVELEADEQTCFMDGCFWPKAAKYCALLSLRCERLDAFHRASYPVISRHLIALNKPTAKPVAVGFAEIRQHRQKRHTKRAGEVGLSARAVGVGRCGDSVTHRHLLLTMAIELFLI
ncbi:MAG: hypothetical protein KIG95_00625 [Comamonas sp.]|nr:hypothetical protein [Comamonas sp.]